MRRHLALLVITLLVAGLFAIFSPSASTTKLEAEQKLGGQASSAYRRPPRQRPKLIVVIVIDQFRYDYLVRFRPQFVARGFNLLLSGANFTDCRYDYATTATCPGHTTLYTGAYANLTGIIANDWYSRSQHRMVYCVEDPNTRLVGGAGGPGFSPFRMMGDTFGDEMRIASGFKSKVIAISLKDRAAIMPGGHLANAAYWFDPRDGRFVTSTYYMSSLPSWVETFNAAGPVKPYCGKPWQALPETPDAGGKTLHQPPHASPCPGMKFDEWLARTPFPNQIELNFALDAIKSERLGQGPGTDLLAISLSANDYVGHAYGPYSPEVADTTLRTDRYLADFFAQLDKTVGLSNVWLALSADHGVAPNPQFIQEHHLGLGQFKSSAIANAVNKAFAASDGQDNWVAEVDEFYINLNHATLKRHGITLAQAEEIAAQAATSVPGVRAAYTYSQLLTGNLPRNPLARKASNSFNARRSGDVFFILDPYSVQAASDTGTNHGTPWSYDAQVPLVFWGSAFKPGTYAEPVQPIDLAPTITAALGLTQPSGAQGKPLTDALK